MMITMDVIVYMWVCGNGDDVYDDGLLRDAQSTERPVMSLPAKHKRHKITLKP
jgi:hypothetical protein